LRLSHLEEVLRGASGLTLLLMRAYAYGLRQLDLQSMTMFESFRCQKEQPTNDASHLLY